MSEIDSRIYTDEPIFRPAGYDVNRTPEKYNQMRRLAHKFDSYFGTDERELVFYEQGKFMEDFEDDYDYRGSFVRYFPTYQVLGETELRGYFSWRTKVRHGSIEPTSLSFVYIYIYELINQIGVSDPEEGFHTLKNFWMAYRGIDSHIDFNVKQWLMDYVIYYDLDAALLEEFSDILFDHSLDILLHCENHHNAEIFHAMSMLSSYNPERSKLYKLHPKDVQTIACRTFVQLAEYYRKHRTESLCESLFGKKTCYSYFMFSSAVFYDRMKYSDYQYTVNDIHKYYCKNGRWTCEKYYNRRKSTELGSILKMLDCRIREKYKVPSTLRPGKTPKYVVQIIDKEIDRYLSENQKIIPELQKMPTGKKKAASPKSTAVPVSAPPVIEIDLSRLQSIRDAAQQTRDKLIVEEEYDDSRAEEYGDSRAEEYSDSREKGPAAEPSGAASKEASASAPQDTHGLTPEEYSLLQCLLYDGSVADCFSKLRRKGLLPSVIADNINEKLFDIFDDTVILFDDIAPELIEDYIDELKGFIKP